MPSVCACAYNATDTCMYNMLYMYVLCKVICCYLNIDLSSEEQDDWGLVYSAASGELSNFKQYIVD